MRAPSTNTITSPNQSVLDHGQKIVVVSPPSPETPADPFGSCISTSFAVRATGRNLTENLMLIQPKQTTLLLGKQPLYGLG